MQDIGENFIFPIQMGNKEILFSQYKILFPLPNILPIFTFSVSLATSNSWPVRTRLLIQVVNRAIRPHAEIATDRTAGFCIACAWSFATRQIFAGVE